MAANKNTEDKTNTHGAGGTYSAWIITVLGDQKKVTKHEG